MEDMIQLIANVSFPIAVATYLLVRIESKISSLTESINSLANQIEKMEYNRDIRHVK